MFQMYKYIQSNNECILNSSTASQHVLFNTTHFKTNPDNSICYKPEKKCIEAVPLLISVKYKVRKTNFSPPKLERFGAA